MISATSSSRCASSRSRAATRYSSSTRCICSPQRRSTPSSRHSRSHRTTQYSSWLPPRSIRLYLQSSRAARSTTSTASALRMALSICTMWHRRRALRPTTRHSTSSHTRPTVVCAMRSLCSTRRYRSAALRSTIRMWPRRSMSSTTTPTFRLRSYSCRATTSTRCYASTRCSRVASRLRSSCRASTPTSAICLWLRALQSRLSSSRAGLLRGTRSRPQGATRSYSSTPYRCSPMPMARYDSRRTSDCLWNWD